MIKKIGVFVFLILFFIGIVFGIYYFSKSQKIEISFKRDDPKKRDNDAVTKKVNSDMELTLDQKIGQLFIISIKGKEVNSETEQFIKDYHPGGILLLGDNIGTETQLKEFIFALQKIALNDTGLPLLFFINQEEESLISKYNVSAFLSNSTYLTFFISTSVEPKNYIDMYKEKVKNEQISEKEVSELLKKILEIKQGV